MSKKKRDSIKVYGTKSGKLYIKPEDLFALERVKVLVHKIANSPSILEVNLKRK